MKYLFLLTGDEERWGTQAPETTQRVMAAHGALERELTEAGRFVDGDPLQPKATAVTVRRRGDAFEVTDGPFAESKEHVGGFYLVEAESLDQAVDTARKLVLPDPTDAVEVRPARTGAQWKGPVRGKERYMLLFVQRPERLARMTREEGFRAIDAHYEISLELAAEGRFWGGRALEAPAASRTLRSRGGETVVHDGPFAEAKEFVAGYFIVACDGRDEAVEIAKRLCDDGGAVEVRPIWDLHDRTSRARSSGASSPR